MTQRSVLAGIGWGVAALLLFGWFFSRFPALYDTDSYYHLAIARAYAQQGLIDQLPWARLSLFYEQFGDKELIFHLLLALGAGGEGQEAGARWGLAAFNALILALIATLGHRSLGKWGLLLPLVIVLGSSHFAARIIRLRPELLALSLLLIATWMAGRNRSRWLGVVSLVFTLSYTAFHALLGLAAAWFVVQSWALRKAQWGLLVYPLIGVGIGLLAHPDFPHNLLVWKVQSVDFFLYKNQLDVGREIYTTNLGALLRGNLFWLLALVSLFCARSHRAQPADQGVANTFSVAALAFLGLFSFSARFAIYAIPFATAAFGFELHRRGYTIGSTIPIVGRLRIPTLLVLTALIGGAALESAPTAAGLMRSPQEGSRQQDWSNFAAAVPPGAKVAAQWGSTHLYMYWAPRAQYLNVLDPIFMALPYPEAYQRSQDIFRGREPDIPTTLRDHLDSEFIALSAFHQQPRVIDRLRGDPRMIERYRGYTLLFEVDSNQGSTNFVTGWLPIPAGATLPITDLGVFDAIERQGATSHEEAFVPLHTAASGRCSGWVRTASQETPGEFELAPAGPTTLWLDDDLVTSISTDQGAVLGEGIRFSIEGDQQLLTVLTCQPESPNDISRGGFFVRRIAGVD